MFLLSRKLLGLHGHIFKQKHHESINLDLVDKFLQLKETFTMDFFQLANVNISLQFFEVLNLKKETLDDIRLSTKLRVHCFQNSIDYGKH